MEEHPSLYESDNYGNHAGRNSSLCRTCQEINIEKALDAHPRYSGEFIARLPEVHKDLRDQNCPFCRLLASVCVPLRRRREDAGIRHQLRAFRGSAMVGLQTERMAEPGVALGVCQGISDKNIDDEENQRCLEVGFLAPVLPQTKPRRAFQVQLVEKERANFELLKLWLQDCRERHIDVCGLSTPSPPSGFQCIDVYTRFIVPVKPNSVYFALSYVWGTLEPEALLESKDGQTRVGKLSGTVQIIEDCMTVVKRLGGQYLWVDQCCISRDNPEEKQHQIRNMDKIYENATATIVAAPANSHEPGLPGVSRYRNVQQPAEWIGPFLMASSLPHVSAVVSNSVWATRGWTFQEGLLSRRCFYFTDYQVYFLCREMTCCESITRPSQLDKYSLERTSFRTDALSITFSSHGRNLTGLWEFFDSLYHYKSRKLSHAYDSINAFQGLLARSGYKTLWGVPIALQTDGTSREIEKALCVGFVRGLWWDNPGGDPPNAGRRHDMYTFFGRRPQFPSWSWAGWDGAIRPHDHRGNMSSDAECNHVDEEDFDTKIWADIEHRAGMHLRMPLPLTRLCKMIDDSGECPPLTHIIHVRAKICRVRIRRHPLSPYPVGYICGCGYYERCKMGHETVHYVRLFEDPLKDVHLSESIFAEFWDVVLLFKLKERSPYSVIASLIIDKHELLPDCFQVRGVVYLQMETIEKMEKRVQSIRIA